MQISVGFLASRIEIMRRIYSSTRSITHEPLSHVITRAKPHEITPHDGGSATTSGAEDLSIRHESSEWAPDCHGFRRNSRPSHRAAVLEQCEGTGLKSAPKSPVRWWHWLAASMAVFAFIACSEDKVTDANDPTLVGFINGTVKDIARIPLTGMRVVVVGGTTHFPEIGVVTDIDGQFIIGGLLPGTFDLGVYDKTGRRLAIATVQVRRGDVSRPDIILGIRGPIVASTEEGEEEKPKAGSIEGVITDPNENPVPGLTVRITDGSTDYPEDPVVTDSAGSYRIAPVPLGTFQISVQEPDGKRVGVGLAKITSDEPVILLHFRAKGSPDSSEPTQEIGLNACEDILDPPPSTLTLKVARDTRSAQAENTNILSRCTATISTSSGSNVAVVTSVLFNGSEAAGNNYDDLRADIGTAAATETTDEVLGPRSFSTRGPDGRHVVFQKNKHVVRVQTTFPNSQPPVGIPSDLTEYILNLARTALSRLP